MPGIVRGRLTYSNVVASMALFIALGGVSYAAVKLPKNSVGGAQIKRNAVTGSKVRNSSLTGSDVKNSSLRGGDIRNSSLTGSDVKDRSLTAADLSGSVQGAQGPAGAKGDTGAKGDAGAKGDTGAKGDAGAKGAAGTAIAYATITSTGAVVESKSKNITQDHVDPETLTGVVCFTGLPFTPRSVMVAAQNSFNGGEADVIATAFLADSSVGTGDCTGKVLVATFDVSSGVLADRPFQIWFQE